MITCFLIFLLVFQSTPQPIHTIELNAPAYVTFLSKLPEEGAVLDLVANKPFMDNEFWAGPDNSLPMLYQTIHEKPMVYGYVALLLASVNAKDKLLQNVVNAKDYAKLWDTHHVRYLVTQETIPAGIAPFTVTNIFDKETVLIYRLGCTCEGKLKWFLFEPGKCQWRIGKAENNKGFFVAFFVFFVDEKLFFIFFS